MDKASFLLNFREQFVDGDDIALDADTPFREIESFDSLTGMAIIVMIKDQYRADVSVPEFKSCETPGALFDLVASKIG